MKPIDGGKYNKRATVQRNSGTERDSLGHPSPVWSDIKTIYVEIAPQGGREFVMAKAVHATLTHLVKCRYQGPSFTIGPKDRIAYMGRIFNVLSSHIDAEAGREYVIACQEEV